MSLFSTLLTKIKCAFKEHSVSGEAKQDLRNTKKEKVTNCVTCGQKLLLTMHEIRPNSYYIDEI